MATSIITNTITNPLGTPVSGVTVTARLKPGPGFRISDSSEITAQVATSSNASGVWTLALERQSNITPTSSWWEIDEQIPDASGGPRVWAISVGSGNATLLASLVTPSANPSLSPYLTQATADSRYLQAGGSNSWTGTQTFTATGSTPTVTINEADWGTALWLKGSGSANSTKLLWTFNGSTSRCMPQFRRSRGTPAAPTAVAVNDAVALFDFAAHDGGTSATADADGNSYGGGVSEWVVAADGNPKGAGTGQVPGRVVLGTCPSMPMLDPGPVDLFWYDSSGWFSFGRRTNPTALGDFCGGNVVVSPTGTVGAAPTVAAVGAGVGHTYQYKIVPCSATGDGIPSAASGSVTNGVLGTPGRNPYLGASTTAAVYNTISLNSLPDGASYYKILRSLDGGAYQFMFSVSNIGGRAYVDDGTDTPAAYTASTTSPGGRITACQFASAANGTTSIATANSSTALSLTGNDAAGKLSFTTDAALAADSAGCTVTFAVPYAAAPQIFLQGTNTNAMDLKAYPISVGTSAWQVALRTAPAGAKQVTLSYWVIP